MRYRLTSQPKRSLSFLAPPALLTKAARRNPPFSPNLMFRIMRICDDDDTLPLLGTILSLVPKRERVRENKHTCSQPTGSLIVSQCEAARRRFSKHSVAIYHTVMLQCMCIDRITRTCWEAQRLLLSFWSTVVIPLGITSDVPT